MKSHPAFKVALTGVARQLSCLVWVVALGAQTPARDTTRALAPLHLLGVYDALTGAPIAGAEVTDMLTGDHTVTPASGTVTLAFIRAGGSIVEVKKLGYQPWRRSFSASDTAAVTVLLERVSELAPVVSSAKYEIAKDSGLRSGITQRCAAGAFISCVDGNIMAASPSDHITDFLRKLPGVETPSQFPGQFLMHPTQAYGHPGQPPYCTPTYYVDGIIWPLRAGFPLEQNGFTTQTVAALEVYDSGVPRPLRFSAGDPSCGAIIIWTRDSESPPPP